MRGFLVIPYYILYKFLLKIYSVIYYILYNLLSINFFSYLYILYLFRLGCGEFAASVRIKNLERESLPENRGVSLPSCATDFYLSDYQAVKLAKTLGHKFKGHSKKWPFFSTLFVTR